MFRKTRLAAALAAVAAAAAISPSGASAATCSPSGDDAAPAFDVQICGASDIDQFRAGLLNNGNAYCGPASLFNTLMYFQKVKGMPVTQTGNSSWADMDPLDPNDYYLVTTRLAALGAMAGQTETGTTATNNRSAFEQSTQWAEDHGWSTSSGYVNSDATAEFGLEIAKRLMKGPVQLWYGRYAKNADGTYSRNGGHAVSVVSAFGSTGTGTVKLYLYDPARNNESPQNLDAQSPYRHEVVTLTKTSIKVGASTRTFWELTGSNYVGTTRQMVETINWFAVAKQ
jgi:hypothetical protein